MVMEAGRREDADPESLAGQEVSDQASNEHAKRLTYFPALV
jgi:hypothetical protein